MAEVILICGKICSGKTTYCNRLKKEINAVALSCDELVLTLFPEGLGNAHDSVSKKARAYLMKKAVEIIGCGQSVILDWGFWSKSLRAEAMDYFSACGVPVKWHYLNVSEAKLIENRQKRNLAVESGEEPAYYVDEGLVRKCNELFEAPDEIEIEVAIS